MTELVLTIDRSAPAMVTGATGYVAGWLIKELLDAGVTVHAAVRNPDNEAKIKHLKELAAAAPGDIHFFKADLLENGSYAEAMKGCSVVFHTASPYTTDVKDPQKELIDPALLGTRNVLNSAAATSEVQRVVLTSSCAAIYTDAADCAEAPGGVLTEDVWNTTASLGYQPYSYSKTVAEKEAWEIAGKTTNFDLVVVNPCAVMGPSINAAPTSASFSQVKMIGDGTLKSGAPKIGIGVVDVRDLAHAHLAAAYTPSANGRNIICAHNTNFLEMAQALLAKFGDQYPIPNSAAPKWLLWLIGPIVAGMPRKFISRNVNIPWKADNSKSVRELGMTYRPLKETMEDMFQQMIDAGMFEKK